MERCRLKISMIEMTDCKHFRYNEIKKRQGANIIQILQISNRLIIIDTIYRCLK